MSEHGAVDTVMEFNRIILGDIREMVSTLPSQSVNTIVTSPPYWGLRDYGTAEWLGGDEDCDHRCQLGGEGQSSLMQNTSAGTQTIQYRHTCAKCGAKRVDKQLGLEETPEEYVTKLVNIFRDLRRVLRDDGTVWLNLGDSYASSGGPEPAQTKWQVDGASNTQNSGKSRTPGNLKPKDLVGIPWMVAFALRADSWYLRSDIIWHKKNPMPESVTDRPTKSHEYIFLLTKSARYYYDQDAIRETASYDGRKDTLMKGSTKLVSVPGQTVQSSALNGTERWPNKTKDGLPGRNKRSVWSISTKPYKKDHFATFPPDLIEPCVLAGCPPGGVVLDPFFGSGTVGEVCVRTGRRWLGVELNADYIALANERISRTQPALFSPGGIG